MERIYLFILFFAISSQLSLAVDGYWEERFPDNPPPPRLGSLISPIGDNKVLLINGGGYNDTWIYDYNANTWEEVLCSFTPKQNSGSKTLIQLSKNRAFYVGGSKYISDEEYICENWIFDLDSMKWFQLDVSVAPSARTVHGLAKLNDTSLILFGGNAASFFPVRLKDTWRCTVTETSASSPYMINVNWNVLNDGKKDPNSPVYYGMVTDLVDLSEDTVMFFARVGDMDGYWDFKLFSGTTNKWSAIGIDSITSDISELKESKQYNAFGYCKLADNIILQFGGSDRNVQKNTNNTYLFIYTNKDNVINAYKINNNIEMPKVFSSTAARINDSTALVFGGTLDSTDYSTYTYVAINRTFIFHLTDRTDPRNLGAIEEVGNEKILTTLDNNIYQLSNIETAVLYDVMGNKISEYKHSEIINTNSLHTGIYILQCLHNKKFKNIKIIKL